jgi:hypothetical protein
LKQKLMASSIFTPAQSACPQIISVRVAVSGGRQMSVVP